MGNIVSIGSINLDIVNHVVEHPSPGETVKSRSTSYYHGGKGANQAIAASLAGRKTTFIGAVGDDLYGRELTSNMTKFGVNTEFMMQKPGPSGMAFITVDQTGENTIVISPGANARLSKADIDETKSALDNATILLQNEIPWEVNWHVMKQASKAGSQIIFNPAPAFDLPKQSFPYINTLIVNETEAERISGIIDARHDFKKLANALIADGLNAIVITLGENGSFYADRNGLEVFCEAFKVTAVDTTAAGDTFIGTYATMNTSQFQIRDRLIYASAAAAICVTREGAHNAIPTHDEIEAFLTSRTNERL